jgi:hypothetical protein
MNFWTCRSLEFFHNLKENVRCWRPEEMSCTWKEAFRVQLQLLEATHKRWLSNCVKGFSVNANKWSQSAVRHPWHDQRKRRLVMSKAQQWNHIVVMRKAWQQLYFRPNVLIRVTTINYLELIQVASTYSIGHGFVRLDCDLDRHGSRELPKYTNLTHEFVFFTTIFEFTLVHLSICPRNMRSGRCAQYSICEVIILRPKKQRWSVFLAQGKVQV